MPCVVTWGRPTEILEGWYMAMQPVQSSARESFAYYGEREGWLKFMGQHRDSDCLARSNFRSALKTIGGEGDTVAIERYSHWAVGWTEVILIAPTDTATIARAEAILAALEDYPVVDEDDWSMLEFET